MPEAPQPSAGQQRGLHVALAEPGEGGADVVEVRLQPVEPLPAGGQLGFGLLDQLQRRGGWAAAVASNSPAAASFSRPNSRIVSSMPNRTSGNHKRADEAVVDQAGQAIEDVDLHRAGRGHDDLGVL